MKQRKTICHNSFYVRDEGERKEDFLLNLKNKKQFIDTLILHFIENGTTVVQAEGDADLLVVEEASNAVKSMDTVVAGEDTDILILLLFHSATESYKHSLYFRSDKDKSEVEHDINHYKRYHENDICRSLLFLHAFTGCDRTCPIFSIGKTSAFKKLIKEKDLQIIATQFLDVNQNHTNIKELGEKAIKILYNYGKEESQKQSLNVIRHEIFKKKVSDAKTFVDSKSLPPTTSALQYHSFRCFYQIQDWISLNCQLDPLQWGWKEMHSKLIPISTDQPAAPNYLLISL